MSSIVTRRVTRDKLAAAVKVHELVKLLENLTQDVTETLPGITDDTLSRIDSLALGVFGKRNPIPPSVRTGDFITLTPDAAGYTLGLNLGQLLAAIKAFSPKPSQPGDVRGGDFVTIGHDAAGVVVGLDLGQLVLALTAYLPRPAAPPPANDAQTILATQVFRKTS